jgi:hypothetical protein
MKIQIAHFLLAATAAIHLPTASGADPIRLDFGGSGQRVHPDFTGVSGSTTTAVEGGIFGVPESALPQGVTMTIASSSLLNFRDRGDFSSDAYGTSAELFEDFIRAGTGQPANGNYSTMTISLAGLLANTPYQTTLRLYDGSINPNSAGTYSFNITGTRDLNPTNNNYSVPFQPFGSPGLSPSEQQGYSETFISDLMGNLQITITQTGGIESSVPLNSLELMAIPEPTSTALALAGTSLLMMKRRRRP